VAPLRIVFMGTPAFACPTLQAIIDRGEEVLAVVTQPDRPKGRGQQLAPPPVKELAESAGLTVLQPVKVRAPEFIEAMRELVPDLIIVIAFGQILPKALLDVPRLGCINIHASLLPRWRGAAPINWCIITGDTETGITTMQMDVGLDTGDMLLKKSIAIDPDEDASSLHDRLAALGADTLMETLDLLKKGELVPETQDDAFTCYAPMLKKEDGAIDWTKDARAVKNLVRGVTPWPGAFTNWEGKTLKVCRVSVVTGEGHPGEVLRADRTGLEVACGSGSLLVHELQLEGRKRLPAAEFLAGCKVAAGSQLGNKDASRE
jgi:methionyl-tRNA formyltransferase